MADIGLSVRELVELERTWALIVKDLRKNGVSLFMSMFEKYPDYMKRFKRFDDLDEEEKEDLERHPTMKAHATSVMRGLSSFIDNLRDVDTLEYLVKDLAQRHYPRKVRVEEYTNFLGLIVPHLEKVLGQEMTRDATNGWKKFLDYLLEHIKGENEVLDFCTN